MKNAPEWEASKYVFRGGKLRASKNSCEVSIGSRLVTNIIAKFYDTNIPLHVTGVLLDIGCGKVPLYEAYRPYISDNICIDWANSAHGCSYLDHEVDLITNLPFADEEFDTIILSDVLEHIPNPERLLGEISRVLTKGGNLIMNVPFLYWVHEAPHDYYRYTEFALQELLARAELDIVMLESLGGAPEVLSDIFAKSCVGIPVVGNSLARLAQWFTELFVKFSIGSRLSARTARKFPLSYGVIATKPEM